MLKYKDKPACYSCKYRRDCPGSAHSKCAHPKNQEDLEDSLQNVLAILGSVGRGSGVLSGGLNVVGHPHGIRNGWFNYPFNFDPVWLEECDGFELKEGLEDEIQASNTKRLQEEER